MVEACKQQHHPCESHAALFVGFTLRTRGRWKMHKKYGLQYEVQAVEGDGGWQGEGLSDKAFW